MPRRWRPSPSCPEWLAAVMAPGRVAEALRRAVPELSGPRVRLTARSSTGCAPRGTSGTSTAGSGWSTTGSRRSSCSSAGCCRPARRRRRTLPASFGEPGWRCYLAGSAPAARGGGGGRRAAGPPRAGRCRPGRGGPAAEPAGRRVTPSTSPAASPTSSGTSPAAGAPSSTAWTTGTASRAPIRWSSRRTRGTRGARPGRRCGRCGTRPSPRTAS